MKIAVDMGHCPKSTGASGYFSELEADRKLGYELIAILRERGHSVTNVTPGDSEKENLTGRAQRANAAGCDKFVSLHFNAGGGSGTEVYTTRSSRMQKEAAFCAENVSRVLGIPNRGHKFANFTVIAKTNMPAMLVETCFVDNKTDFEAFSRTSYKDIAAAIADAIMGVSTSGSGSQPARPAQPAKPETSGKDPRPITVDGKWGRDTNLALQYYFDAPYKDGKISRQNRKNRNVLAGCTTGWEWQEPPVSGSQTIRLLQGACGMPASEIDGVQGRNTNIALQKHLKMDEKGHIIDGVLDYPSPAVAEMQRRLNDGTL